VVELALDRDGAERRKAAVDHADLAAIVQALAGQPSDQAGIRLFGVAALYAPLSRDGVVGAIAADVLGQATRPVRAILFDKTPAANWSLGWHQDRVIAVEARFEVDGFGPWSRKHGALHVAPPFSLLSRMLTVRLHIDAVTADNAPLLVAPGSHHLGRIATGEVESVVNRCGRATCLAESGDVWVYATPVLHASDIAQNPRHRRVLQVDYAAFDLPEGLNWLGI